MNLIHTFRTSYVSVSVYCFRFSTAIPCALFILSLHAVCCSHLTALIIFLKIANFKPVFCHGSASYKSLPSSRTGPCGVLLCHHTTGSHLSSDCSSLVFYNLKNVDYCSCSLIKRLQIQILPSHLSSSSPSVCLPPLLPTITCVLSGESLSLHNQFLAITRGWGQQVAKLLPTATVDSFGDVMMSTQSGWSRQDG